MRKLLCALLVLSLLCALGTGCGKKTADAADTQTPPAETVTEPAPEPEPEPVKLNYDYLNGLYDLADDRVGKRPFAVSVNNNYAGWPQYGISKADIIVEIETEGGITRLMAIFSDVSDAGYIGSIRSLRHPFVAAVGQWDPIITHIGTSTAADEFLNRYGIQTLNGYYTDSFLYVDKVRLQTYASEHCKFTRADLLPAGIEDLGVRTDLEGQMQPAFNFTADTENKIIPSGGAATSVTFEFSGAYDGDLRYDAATQKYLKWQDGKAQIDAGNGNAQLSFDNALVLFASIGGVANTELVDVDYADGGEGYYFSQGRYEHFTWVKPAWDESFQFTKDDGSALVLNTGTTYLAVTRNYFDDTLEIH